MSSSETGSAFNVQATCWVIYPIYFLACISSDPGDLAVRLFTHA